jgi:hypothetical protein
MFQLPLNYTDHIRIVPFALAATPSLGPDGQVARRRYSSTLAPLTIEIAMTRIAAAENIPGARNVC